MWVPSMAQEETQNTATHSSIPDWRVLWTEGPGSLQSIGSQRVRHYWSDLAQHVLRLLSYRKLIPRQLVDITDFTETTLGDLFNHYPNWGVEENKSRKILGDLCYGAHAGRTGNWSKIWASPNQSLGWRIRSCTQGLFEQSSGREGEWREEWRWWEENRGRERGKGKRERAIRKKKGPRSFRSQAHSPKVHLPARGRFSLQLVSTWSTFSSPKLFFPIITN